MIDDITKELNDKKQVILEKNQNDRNLYSYLDGFCDEVSSSVLKLLDMDCNLIFFDYILLNYEGNKPIVPLRDDTLKIINTFNSILKNKIKTSAKTYFINNNVYDDVKDTFDNISIDIETLFKFYKDLKKIVIFKQAADEVGNKEQFKKPLDSPQLDNLRKSLANQSVQTFNKEMYKKLEDLIKINEERREIVKKDVKLSNKQLVAYSDVINYFDKNRNKDIYDVPNGLLKITDENLKVHILNQIKDHNDISIKKYKDMHNNINSENNIELCKLFNNYNIDIKKYDININIPLDLLKNILAFIISIGIKNELDILRIVKATTPSHIDTLSTYVAKNMISKELLENNLILFDPTAQTTINLLTNINLISSYISLTGEKHDVNSILLCDSDVIKENLNILEEYNYTTSLKKCRQFQFLTENNLENKLTLLIELGLSNYIKTDINVLNYSLDRLKRLKLYDYIEESYNDPYEILENNNFFISDKDIDKYLYKGLNNQYSSGFITREEFISRLNNYDFDEYTYNIKGVLISKKKVQKLLKKIEYVSNKLIDEILFKDSYLEQYELIKVHSSIVEDSTRTIGKNY